MNYKEAIKAYPPIHEQEKKDKQLILEYIEKFPETVLTRANEWGHLTSSGFIMNPNLDKVLMIHHNIYHTWAWTGGHADGDEDLLYVAIKEAKEETGVQEVYPLMEEIASIDILPVSGHFKRGNYVATHLHLNVAYILIAEERQQLQVKKDENSGVRWLDINELEEYCNEPEIIKIYSKLITRAKDYKKDK